MSMVLSPDRKALDAARATGEVPVIRRTARTGADDSQPAADDVATGTGRRTSTPEPPGSGGANTCRR